MEAEEEGVLEQFGNYDLLEKVAVGGMAELFKARQRGDPFAEKTVAIKRILPHLSDNDEFVRMFIDEAKLAAQLSHPNIVQIYDLGKAGGSYYIAMEYVDGRDLRSLLRKLREYKLPMPEVPGRQRHHEAWPSALDYAHRKRGIDDKELRLVHRDVSPQNILISYDGAVKLVDFGIAKAATRTFPGPGRGPERQAALHEPRTGPGAAAGRPVGHLFPRPWCWPNCSPGNVATRRIRNWACWRRSARARCWTRARSTPTSLRRWGASWPRPCRRTWTSAMLRPACWSGT